MSQPKTRILFVDDEPIILELISLTVSSMKSEWDLSLAKTAEQAQELIAQAPFDVVISDMQLPGRTGAQLLNEVMQKHPATIRIILSGHGDQELVMKCVGATHQFLLKPFKLQELKSALKRIDGLKQRLHSPRIQRLVAKEQCLPTIPDVYFKILDSLQDPDCPIEKIGKIVATDPALATKLLQIVNSAFLGVARHVASADEAVMLVGTGTIRSLALTLHLFSAFKMSGPEDTSLEQLWSHSARVGRIAQRIAKLENGSDKFLEECFTAGLLHDVGKLLLAENPEINYLSLMSRARKERQPLIEAELAALGATHAEAGAYLLDLWGLPTPLVEAVAFHHEPGRAAHPEFSPLTVVHAANCLAQEATACQEARSGLDHQYLERLGLSERIETWHQAAVTD